MPWLVVASDVDSSMAFTHVQTDLFMTMLTAQTTCTMWLVGQEAPVFHQVVQEALVIYRLVNQACTSQCVTPTPIFTLCIFDKPPQFGRDSATLEYRRSSNRKH